MKSLDLDPKLLQKNLKYDNMNVGFCMKKMEEQMEKVHRKENSR